MNKKNHTIRINKTAIKVGVNPEYVQEVVENYIDWVGRKVMSDENMVDIIVPRFGRFTVDYKRLRTKILKKIRRYKRGDIGRERCVDYVSRLYPVYKRQMAYVLSRRVTPNSVMHNRRRSSNGFAPCSWKARMVRDLRNQCIFDNEEE